MASSITSAGAASGIDFESIITASVQAKKASLTKVTKQKRNNLEIEISGVSTLKSRLSTFQDSLKALTEESAFNARKVTTSQPKDVNVFTIETKNDASNLNFDLTVTQLAKSEKANMEFSTAAGFENSFKAGTMTIDLGADEEGKERKFDVEIKDGDTLELIRKRINQNDFGVNVSLIKTTDGYTFGIDSGVTGKGASNLSISVAEKEPAEGEEVKGKTGLSVFNMNTADKEAALSAVGKDGAQVSVGGWKYTAGQDAKVLLDGKEITSKTNTFDDDQISGVKLVVNRLSETETVTDADGKSTTGFKSYNVDISTDEDAATNKMQSFVNAYNDLVSSLDKLYKHNTYTNGKSNEDGGDLAGDATVVAIKSRLLNMVSSFKSADSGKTIFDAGIKFTKDGTLELDKTKFKDAMKTSYNSVVDLFTSDEKGKEGIITKLNTFMTSYTESNGILDTRKDRLNTELRSVSKKETDNESFLEKYEESLRAKYANLDTLISSYNSSMSYLSSVIGQQ